MAAIRIWEEKASPVWRYLSLTAACILLVAALSACASERHDATIERVLALEAKLHALEESLEAAQEENAALKSELAALRQEQTDFLQRQEAAVAAEEHEEEVADFEEGQEEQLAALEEGQARNDQRFDDLDSRLRELEAVAAQVELLLPVIETWFKGKDEGPESPEAAELEMTAGLAEEAGGEVHYIGHPAREDRAILVTPPDAIEGEIPLIVSLHGYGGNSAVQSMYLPLHRRVNADGFALLLPNGTRDSEGNRFWNPTDQCCDGGKSGEGRRRLSDRAYSNGAGGRGLRAGLLLRLLQRRVHGLLDGLPGTARPARRRQPGRNQLHGR